MPYTIDARLHPDLAGFAWLIGHWEGTGEIPGPDETPTECAVTVDFTENGRGYLHYLMQWFTTDAAGVPQTPLGLEAGFWRAGPDGAEVVLAHPEGYAEVYLGTVRGAQIELRTDVVARTGTADVPVTGGHRLYGNVEGALMFALDRGTSDEPLAPYLWARLVRA